MDHLKLRIAALSGFALVLAFGGTFNTLRADLLAYEGFDTDAADGTNLPTMQGGDTSSGWGDQWRFNAANGLGITVDSPGLDFGSLDTVGKLATSNFDGSSAGFYRRDMETSYTIGSGAGERVELWASWLTTWSGNGDGTGGNGLQWFKLHNGNSEVISAGINNWGGVRGTELEDQWRLAPGTASEPADSFTGVVAQPDVTYRLSLRLSAAGDDTLIEFFVNSADDSAPGSPLATHTVTGSATIDQVRLQTQQTNITAQWDEIRIGETAADVGLTPGTEAAFPLTITPATAPATGFDLEWKSRAGKIYSLRASTDLNTPIADWDLVQGDLQATPPFNLFNVDPLEPRRFYAVEEFDAPPLFGTGFEDDDGGFTVVTLAGTSWEHGAPDSPDQGGGAIQGGNGGSALAWGTGLTDTYTSGTDTSLRSPVIDLTGVAAAELSFAQSLDADAGDTLEVNVIGAATETVIAVLIPATEDAAPSSSPWEETGPIALPAAALGQEVRFEWRFRGETSSTFFNGAYIDDVVVRENAP